MVHVLDLRFVQAFCKRNVWVFNNNDKTQETSFREVL
ncbi:hypothetical protein X975_10173, partial [Stegodyphus mimosarum]